MLPGLVPCHTPSQSFCSVFISSSLLIHFLSPTPAPNPLIKPLLFVQSHSAYLPLWLLIIISMSHPSQVDLNIPLGSLGSFSQSLYTHSNSPSFTNLLGSPSCYNILVHPAPLPFNFPFYQIPLFRGQPHDTKAAESSHCRGSPAFIACCWSVLSCSARPAV